MPDVYKETRPRVAYLMSKSENKWTQAAQRKKTLKVENAVVTEAQTTTEEVRLKIEENAMQLDGERIKQERKPTQKMVKTALQKATKQIRIETYQSKD